MTRILTLLLLLLLPGSALAQADGAVRAATDEDLEEFRAAYARYTERMDEIRAEIKRIVTHRYQEEMDRLTSKYDTRTDEIELEERERRLEAIRMHEEFVAKYPDSPYTAHRMFRLADLYLEETDYQFLVAQSDYRKLEDAFDAGEIKSLPEPPGKNYARAIRIYKRLISDFPEYKYLDAVYYLLGYCYWDDLSEQQDDALALETYHELVERLPDSRYAANGFFQLGEIYFEELEFDKSIEYYTRVMDMEAEDLYDRALYKLAWAYYRKDDLANAIPRFVQLIDYSDTMLVEEGKESQLKPESLKYLAISLVDEADDALVKPMDRAEQFFGEIGDRAYEYEVYTGIDDVLWQQGRYNEELETLVRLQQLYPESPDNPDFQYKVMQLHYLKDNPDPDAAVAARIELVERFKEGTPWWEANKGNPDALRAASDYIEESLLDVAKTYHASAQKMFTEPGEEPARAEYLKAAAAYQDYLNRFPFAKDAYETQYQIAECYFWAGDYERAVAEYKKMDSYPDRTYYVDTLDSLAFAYERLMNERSGDYKTNASALANVEIELGDRPEQIPVLPISEDRMNFITAADQLYEHDPTHEDIPRKLYIASEIFYYHNQMDEAQKRFQTIIDRYPQLPFSAYAAGLMVDLYHKTGQLDKVYDTCVAYLQIPMLGDDEELWKERLEFYEIKKRNAQFKLAEKAGAGGDIKGSGSMFEDFYREYPESENAALSLFNAALQYEKSGDTIKSNELYEEFLRKYEKDERAPSIFFRIAGQYERTMDLDKAIEYYEKVATLHKKYEHAGDAYFNAAFLSLGIKKYDQAARYYLKYANDFEVEDEDEAYWRAAEAYYEGGDYRQALETYQAYNRKFGDKDVNRTMESLIKQAEIYEKQRDSRKLEQVQQQILTLYDESRGIGAELNTVSVAAAAEIAFPELEAMLDEYDQIKLPNVLDQEKLQPVLDEKKAAAKRISEKATEFLTTYPDFNYIMACMYIQANVIQKYADMIYAWKPPYDRNIMGPKTEDTKFEWEDLITEQQITLAEPFEIEAQGLFELVIEEAKKRKQNAPYVEKARQALHKVDPNSYPLLKPHRVQFGRSDYKPMPEPKEAPVEETS